MQKKYNIVKEFVSDFNKYCFIINILLSFIISSLLLSSISSQSKTNFENLALNRETTSLHNLYNSQSYYCKDLRDSQNCINGSSKRDLNRRLLWLGNSQIDAVNQFRKGQKNAPLILHELLSKKKEDLIAFSEPNASLQEHYVLFEYLSSKIKLDYLILPLVFDDTRETGIRDSVALGLKDESTISSLNKTTIGKIILKECSKSSIKDSDLAGLKMTPQKNIEKSINSWLDKNFYLWSIREKARGNIFVWLYQLRNSIFSIKAESKRRIIKGRYIANVSSLKEILISAKQKNIEVITYIAPIRNDVEIPYDRDEYNIFKSETEKIVKMNGGIFYNLEKIVPSDLWGTKESTNTTGKPEIDYMHFKYKGHRLLALKLFSILESLENREL